jgi:hypothetical protein
MCGSSITAGSMSPARSYEDSEMAGAEEVAIRTEGGPFPGTRVVTSDWPLPEFMHVDAFDGFYHKVAESGLPPQDADSHLMRSAQYEWVAAP